MQRRNFLRAIFGGAALWPLAGRAGASAQRNSILIQTSPLAGFQYHTGEQCWAQLREGDPLSLRREAENRYDKQAVAVYWRDAKLGYVPRSANIAISQMLDRGQPLQAVIDRLQASDDPWQRVRFEVRVQIG